MKEITLDAKLGNLDEVLAFVDSRLEELECPVKAQMQIDVAVEEIFVNIASYAYEGQPGSATIRMEIRQNPKSAEITFLDRGIPYNPVEKEDPDVSLPIEKRRIGGLGIYMVKKSMDEMLYERRDGYNILTIIKIIS